MIDRDRGLLERVYGGALSVRSTEGDCATRSALHATRKRAIAQLAATLVEPEDTIVIDIGTTALEVARALPGDFRGRVPGGSGWCPGAPCTSAPGGWAGSIRTAARYGSSPVCYSKRTSWVSPVSRSRTIRSLPACS